MQYAPICFLVFREEQAYNSFRVTYKFYTSFKFLSLDSSLFTFVEILVE